MQSNPRAIDTGACWPNTDSWSAQQPPRALNANHMLLAIDTATSLLGIALHDGDRLLAECTLTVDRSHSAVLAPMIKQIMERTGVAGDELTALAVSVGPGSYTGLRIGVALAKGMAGARVCRWSR